MYNSKIDYKAGRGLTIENAHIFYREFTKNGKYSMGFCVAIDTDTARKLRIEGWNVKTQEPREEGDIETYYIPVTIKFGEYPPTIYTISGKKKTLLTESSLKQIQNARFENVDIIISPYSWENNGKSGVKAYLKTMYATLETNDLDRKYAYLDNFDDEEDGDAPF